MSYYQLHTGKIEDLGGLVKNSINLIVGPQGCGKTYLMNQLAKKFGCDFDEIYHVAPKRTVTDYPVHSVEEMEQWLQQCDEGLERQKSDVDAVNTFVASIRHPHLGFRWAKNLPQVLARYKRAKDVEIIKPRLLCVDDMGGHAMFRRPTSTFSTLARQLRHIGITPIICCHNIRDVSPAIRSYTGAITLYGGVPKNDLEEIYKNKGTPYTSYQDFVRDYTQRTMKRGPDDHPYMYLTFVG